MCIAIRSYRCGFIEHSHYDVANPCACSRKRYLEPARGECAACRSRGDKCADNDTPVNDPNDAFILVNNLTKLYINDQAHVSDFIQGYGEKEEAEKDFATTAAAAKGAAKEGNEIGTPEKFKSPITVMKGRNKPAASEAGKRNVTPDQIGLVGFGGDARVVSGLTDIGAPTQSLSKKDKKKVGRKSMEPEDKENTEASLNE